MSLYNAKSEGEALRVTKFDADFNVVEGPNGFSSYLVTETTCTCPAGHRRSCRHREMYSALLKIADTYTFFDYETGDYATTEDIEQ